MNTVNRGHLLFCSILILIFTFSVCADTPDQNITMYQASSYDMVESGNYYEVFTVDDMQRLGDFGLGGYEDLDGELTQIDGNIYQIRSDGTVSEPPGDTGICFANTVLFRPEYSLQFNNTLDKEALFSEINKSFSNHDAIYAYRIDGTYSNISVRSVPPQEEPYPSLAEVVGEQSIFNLENVSGTVSGFWFPEWMQGVNYAGFHTHFITDSRDAGGHVLDVTSENVTVSVQPIHRFTMIFAEDNKENRET